MAPKEMSNLGRKKSRNFQNHRNHRKKQPIEVFHGSKVANPKDFLSLHLKENKKIANYFSTISNRKSAFAVEII